MDEILSIYPKSLWTKTKQKSMITYRLFGYLNNKIKEVLPNKQFQYDLLKQGHEQRKVFIDELKYWDSHENSFKRSFTYTSKEEQNIDVIQALCSVTNVKSYKRHNGYSWVLSIKDHPTTRGENLKTSEIPFKDKVACLSVPSTFVLVRYKGKTTITGQTINFGMAYGKGAYGFSKDFNISEDEAQKILDQYFAALPKVKEAIDKAHNAVRKNGYVKSMTGRRRHFQPNEMGFYPNSAFRESFNFLIQGYSADMIRMACNACYKLSERHKQWDLKQVMTVHDETVFIVKEQFAETAAENIKRCFENVTTFSVPIVADVDVGNSYSEVK
jgi:hypothetical protein